MLTKKWLVSYNVQKNEQYHPMVENFYEFLAKFQEHQGEEIVFWCRISLPSPVKPDFEEHVLVWKGTEQIVLFLIFSALAGNYNPHVQKLEIDKV